MPKTFQQFNTPLPFLLETITCGARACRDGVLRAQNRCVEDRGGVRCAHQKRKSKKSGLGKTRRGDFGMRNRLVVMMPALVAALSFSAALLGQENNQPSGQPPAANAQSASAKIRKCPRTLIQGAFCGFLGMCSISRTHSAAAVPRKRTDVDTP